MNEPILDGKLGVEVPRHFPHRCVTASQNSFAEIGPVLPSRNDLRAIQMVLVKLDFVVVTVLKFF